MTRDTHSEEGPESVDASRRWYRLTNPSDQLRVITLTLLLAASLPAMIFIFSSGAALAQQGQGTVIDDFEDGNLSEWSGGSGAREIETDIVREGDNSMSVSGTDVTRSINATDRSTYGVWAYFPDGHGQFFIRPGGFDRLNVAFSEPDMEVVYDDGSGFSSTGINYQEDKWYLIRYTNIDYDNYTYDIELHDENGLVGSFSGAEMSTPGGIDSINLRTNGGPAYVDYITADYDGIPREPITGQVANQNGDSIGGATVTLRNAATDSETTVQTNSEGEFSARVDSGQYEIEISADGYQTLTENRDIEEGDELGTFQLAPQQLDLQFNRFVEPGDSTPYTVEYTDGNGTTMDVTGDVTMNSSNVSIATVDTGEVEIVGSEGVNGTSEITANYTVNNTTYTDTRTVTVATKTVDNLEIIPGTWRLSALLDDITIQVILVAIGAAIVATRAASSWAGLGAMELVVIIGWFADWVPLGIMLLGLFTALFIGLNLAANIDYSVRR